jgi:hypothetical protein
LEVFNSRSHSMKSANKRAANSRLFFIFLSVGHDGDTVKEMLHSSRTQYAVVALFPVVRLTSVAAGNGLQAHRRKSRNVQLGSGRHGAV